MPKAVRFDEYGGLDVLKVVDVPRPTVGPRDVLVGVVAAGINPGESAIREGALAEQFPGTFPSGQGSDLAGRVVEFGAEVTDRRVGEEVFGWSENRNSQAELVAVPSDQLVPKPAGVDWDQAGSLYVVGATAWAAVDAVDPQPGETVAVSAAAGGVGTVVVQLLRRRGARVLGIAGPANAEWLREQNAEPVEHGDGLEDRLRTAAPDGIAAAIDCFGDGYVELFAGLGVPPARIDTIIDFAGAERFGAQTKGSADGTSTTVLARLADLIAAGELSIPIAATYPLDEVRDAFTRLADRHTRGKIVLHPGS